MKALEILKEIDEQINRSSNYDFTMEVHFNKAYQVRVKKAIEELENLQNENKSLVKTLEKYNEEMIELRKQNQDLLNTIIEAQEAIENILERNK